MKLDNICAAIQNIRGAVDEAQTIITYSEQINFIAENNPAALTSVLENYAEILGDELNHLIRFAFKYAELTEVKIAEDGLEGGGDAD